MMRFALGAAVLGMVSSLCACGGDNCKDLCNYKCQRGFDCQCGDTWNSEQSLQQCKQMCEEAPAVDNPTRCQYIQDEMETWECGYTCVYLNGG